MMVLRSDYAGGLSGDTVCQWFGNGGRLQFRRCGDRVWACYRVSRESEGLLLFKFSQGIVGAKDLSAAIKSLLSHAFVHVALPVHSCPNEIAFLGKCFDFGVLRTVEDDGAGVWLSR